MWQKLLAFIFPNPSMCVLCETRTDALTVCEDCQAHWRVVAEQEGQCYRCGHFGTRARVCDICRDWPRYFLGNTAFLPYDGDVAEAIKRFKYAGEPWRAEGFAALFAERSAPRVDVIVPVPLHKKRLRERGYNQSKLLAQVLAAVWQLPMRDDLLARTVNTRHQVGLSKTERRQNVNGAFAVPERVRADLAGKRVLLVDDVITTGSTLLACAKALHQAGAAQVQSVTLVASIQ